MNAVKKITAIILSALITASVFAFTGITAFAASQYTVTATALSGGTISPLGNTSVSAHKSLTYTVTPEDGYAVASVTVDGTDCGALLEYTFTDISSDHTITAAFKGTPAGDADGDGYVTENDLKLLRTAVLVNDTSNPMADANGDGSIDLLDIVAIKHIPRDLLTQDFSAASASWNVGSSSGTATVSNDGKIFSFDTTQSNVDSLYYQGDNSSKWADYQVSADIFYDNYDFTQKSSYIALVYRRMASNKSYEFRLSVSADDTANIVGELYKRNTDGYTLLKTFDYDYIQNTVGAFEMALGRYYNVKSLAKGNTSYFFINNRYIGSYTDTDAPFLTGSVGIKSYRAKGSLKNLRVTDRTNKTYKGLNIASVPSGSEIAVHSGTQLNFEEYRLSVADYDGTTLSARMSDGELSYGEFKNGKNTVGVNIFGLEKDFVFNVTKRSVSGIETRLLSNKGKTVSVNNALVYKSLLRDCDKYSDYELSYLSNEAKAAYNELSQKLAALNVPFGGCTVADNFAEDTSSNYQSDFEMKKGSLYVKNGNLNIVQIPYGVSTNCFYFDGTYQKASSVSADIKINSYDAAGGVILNANSVGYYYATLSLNKDADNVNARNSAILRVYKKVSGESTRIIMARDIDICRNEWFNMQLCITDDNQLKVYIDYQPQGSYGLQNETEIFTEGQCGIVNISGDVSFDNFTVYGNSAVKPVPSQTAVATRYTADFENETAGQNPDKWLERNGEDYWRVCSQNGNKYYGISGGDKADEILFLDDFNSYGNNASGVANKNAMIAKGWNTPNNTTGNYNNSQSFAVPALATANLACVNVSGSDLWSDYSVESDMLFPESTTGNCYSYIAGRISGKTGYWLRVWAKDGVLRSLELQSYANDTKKDVLGTYSLTAAERLQPNTVFNIKMRFSGNAITCYLNGRAVITATDSTYSSGACGIRTSSQNVSSTVFDNFAVKVQTAVAPKGTDTYLHLFESNPTFNAKMRFDSQGNSDARFGLAFRNSPYTAYVKLCYNTDTKIWSLTETQCETDLPVNTFKADETCPLENGVWYDISIALTGDSLTLKVSGGDLESDYNLAFSGISNRSTGKMGIFTENCLFDIDNVDITLPDGDTALSGVSEIGLYPDDYAATFEIEKTGTDTLIGVGYDKVAFSYDNGLTFEDKTSEYSYLCDGSYPSILKLHDGKFIRVNGSFQVFVSSNNMASWTNVCDKLTEYKTGNRVDKIFHNNSLTEVKLQNGNYRIFLPVGVRLYSGPSTSSSGHYTQVYYSDDGGVSWSCSSADTRDILYGSKNSTTMSWCESKVIACNDGTLRMYYSRNALGCMQYTESFDGGVTWHGLYQIPQMQCAASSFSVIKDNSSGAGSTEYYMVWVNDMPVSLGSPFSRARLSLAHSTDGKTWEYLCDVDRMAREAYGSDLSSWTPLFQIVDPSINVTDDYVFVTYGCSSGSGIKYHNAQRINLVRIEKSALSPKAWDASNISDLTFTESIELVTAPTVIFTVGSTFTYSGGKVRVTRLDGTTYEKDTARYGVAVMPDMNTKGKQTVTLYDFNGFSVSYEIEIRDLVKARLTANRPALLASNAETDTSEFAVDQSAVPDTEFYTADEETAQNVNGYDEPDTIAENETEAENENGQSGGSESKPKYVNHAKEETAKREAEKEKAEKKEAEKKEAASKAPIYIPIILIVLIAAAVAVLILIIRRSKKL